MFVDVGRLIFGGARAEPSYPRTPVNANLPNMEPMKRAPLGAAVLALIACTGCGTNPEEEPMMEPTQPGDSGPAGLESDPSFYKRSSVIGEVSSADGVVPNATITVVKSGETHTADETGTFVIVLDPDKLGTRQHELVISAPGFSEHREVIYVPRDKQVKIQVTLEPRE